MQCRPLPLHDMPPSSDRRCRRPALRTLAAHPAQLYGPSASLAQPAARGSPREALVSHALHSPRHSDQTAHVYLRVSQCCVENVLLLRKPCRGTVLDVLLKDRPSISDTALASGDQNVSPLHRCNWCPRPAGRTAAPSRLRRWMVARCRPDLFRATFVLHEATLPVPISLRAG